MSSPQVGRFRRITAIEFLSNNTCDIGSSSKAARNGYFGGNLTVAGTMAITGAVTLAGGLGVTGDVTITGDFITSGTNKGVKTSATSGLLNLQTGTGGAYLQLAGVANGSLGALFLGSGSNASSHINITIGHASSSIKFQNTSSASLWTINNSGTLAQDATNGGSLVLSKASTSVAQPVVTGITAAGTTVTDATALTGVHNVVSTVASGTGVKLWAANTGTTITVQNLGANDLEVYPVDGSGTINGAAGGAGITLAAATDVIGVFTKISSTAWTGFVSAGVAT